MMYLVKLIYASRPKTELNEHIVEDILASSLKNNGPQHISGILCFDSHFFLQCLEGPRTAVNALYSKIIQDPRQQDSVILQYETIATREFSQWEMAYVGLTHQNKAKLYQFGLTDTFDPYSMSGESANQLLISLKQEL